jgi:hypothetical protein
MKEANGKLVKEQSGESRAGEVSKISCNENRSHRPVCLRLEKTINSVEIKMRVTNSLDFSFQVQHCQDGLCGFFTFVAEFPTCPLNRL